VGPRAGLDGRKISSPSGFDPGPSSPKSVALLTELPDPHTHTHTHIYIYTYIHARAQKIYIYIYIYTLTHLCTFTIISRSILLRIRNVLDESCTENQNTHFMFDDFFPKIIPFMR